MRLYSLASEPTTSAALPDKREERSEPESVYDWALGRRPAGTAKESAHVQIESAARHLGARELAKLVRGEEM